MHCGFFVVGNRAGDQRERLLGDHWRTSAHHTTAHHNSTANCTNTAVHSDPIHSGRRDRNDSNGERVERCHQHERCDYAGRYAAGIGRRKSSSRSGRQQRDNFLGCSIRERRIGLGRARCDACHGIRAESAANIDASTTDSGTYANADTHSDT